MQEERQVHFVHGHAPGATQPVLSLPAPPVPGYLRVEGVARVRPPAQLLGAHPLTLHRGVVCEAVKDRHCGQGRGGTRPDPRRPAASSAGCNCTTRAGHLARAGDLSKPGHALHPQGSRSAFSAQANKEMTGPVEPCIPAVHGRIYLTSFGSIGTGGKTLQSQTVSVTRSRRLLLIICCATNILQGKSR